MSSAVGIFIPGSDRRLTALRWVSKSTKSSELGKTLVEQWVWSFDSDAEKIGAFLLSTKTVWTALLKRDFTLLPDYMEEADGNFPAWMDNLLIPPNPPVFKGMVCHNTLGNKLDISWYYIFDTEANELHIYQTAGKGGIRYPDRIIRLGKRFDNYHGSLHRFELYAVFESLISDAIRDIILADEWLAPLDDYTDCVTDRIPKHLDGQSCEIEASYARMSRYWGQGTQFHGHTQDHVVEVLHRDYLQEVGLDDWDEEEEFDVVVDPLMNKKYFDCIMVLQVILGASIEKGKMLTPIADYRTWAIGFDLGDWKIALICQAIYDIQKAAWRDNVYYGRHDWYILKDVHIEMLVNMQGKG